MDETKDEIEEVVLVSNIDDVTISQICAILDENNIPYSKIDEGAGSAMNVYMGFSNLDKRIVVNKEDYEKAKELISPVLTTKEEEGLEEEDLPDELKEDVKNMEDEEKTKKAHKMLRQIFGFLVVIIPTIIVLFVLILGNLLY